MNTPSTPSNWAAHVRAAHAAGQTLAAYARAHQLPAQSLYAAQTAMRRRGESIPSSASRNTRPRTPQSSAFVPVTVSEAVAVTVQFPNGMRAMLSLTDCASLRTLLHELVQLPCSL